MFFKNALCVVLFTLFGIVSCGGDDSDSPKSSPPVSPSAPPDPTPPPTVTPVPVANLTAELVYGKEIVQIGEVRDGWLPVVGEILDFADDGELSYWRKNFRQTFGSAPGFTTHGTSITEGKLSIAGTEVLYTEYPQHTPGFIGIGLVFGEDIARAYQQVEDEGRLAGIQHEIRTGETGRNYKFIAMDDNLIRVSAEIQTFKTLLIDLSVQRVLNDGRTEVTVSETISENLNWIVSPSSQLGDNGISDISGTWIMPMAGFLGVAATPNGAPTDFDSAREFKDKVTLNDDYSASSIFSGVDFSWAFEDGEVTLTHDIYSIVYIPILRNDKEWLTLIKIQSEGVLLDYLVDKVSKFDETYVQFGENFVTNYPEIYTSLYNGHEAESWVDDRISLEYIFGYKFDDDGVGWRPILASNEGTEETPMYIFERDSREWEWSVDGRTARLIRRRSDGIERDRLWDIISVDSLGRALVYESETWQFEEDEKPFLSISPRIIYILKVDLSDWPEVWGRSDVQ